jgi:hypothetical protein
LVLTSSNWNVFEPGAAHIWSSTKWSRCTSRKSGGTMLTASCLVMFPVSFSSFKNSWNLSRV